MRLHDLVDDGQPESGAAFKVRLEGLKNLFNLLRRHSGSGIGKADLPVIAQGFDRDGQRAAVFHGADGVLAEIPEDLLDLVAVGECVKPGARQTAARIVMPVFSAVMR